MDILPAAYFSDERKALTRLIDAYIIEMDDEFRQCIDCYQLKVSPEIENHIRSDLVNKLMSHVRAYILQNDLIKIDVSKDMFNDRMELRAKLDLAFLKRPDDLKAELRSAINELTEYQDEDYS